MILLTGAKPVIVNTTEAAGFKITANQLEKAITPNTRAIVLNSPSNPTGSGYCKEELEALAECALKHKLLIVSDEIYDRIVFDDFKATSIASLGREVQNNCVVINGVSKSFAMTGWRIGYLAAQPDIVQQISKYQGQSTSNPTSISQAAAVEALLGPQGEVEKMIQEFQRRRDVALGLLLKIPEVSCYCPVGAFYTFPNFSAYYRKKYGGKTINGSIDLAQYLLEEAKVALVPGIAFGSDLHARISFATSMDNIEQGLSRISQALAKLQ
jgi:aspartate aminotransferase